MTSLTVLQGTDAGIRWLVNDGDTGLPFDFDGWSVRSQIRRSVGADHVLHEFSTTIGNATAMADGHITLTWSAAETSAWDFTEAVYSIEISSPVDPHVIRLDSGRLTVSKEITR